MAKLLAEKHFEGEFKTSLLQYPPVFQQALFKLSWAQAPKKILEEYTHKKAPVNVMPDYEERAWAMWGNLQAAHRLD